MDVIERLLRDKPAFHAGGALRWDTLPETLRYIGSHVAAGQRTIETGCGVSTIVFASVGAIHTVISPDAREHERVLDYCRQIGLDASSVTFAVGFSDEELPKLTVNEAFDFAFIDGAHAFPYPIVDWHYISKALKVGGAVIVDDIPIPSISVLYQYMCTETCWRLDAVLDGRAAAFALDTAIQPEDWTSQPFNKRPDYSFLPVRERSQAIASHRAAELRRLAGRRMPVLRRLARQARR